MSTCELSDFIKEPLTANMHQTLHSPGKREKHFLPTGSRCEMRKAVNKCTVKIIEDSFKSTEGAKEIMTL
jgi:hypothetical protein